MMTIEAMMVGSTRDDVAKAMKALSSSGLGFAAGEVVDWREKTEVYFLVLQRVPADILNAAVLVLVETEEFFPTVAKWLKVCDTPLAERHRMKSRIREMIEGVAKAEAAPAFVREAPHVRLAGMVASYRKNGFPGRSAAKQQELYELAQSTVRACAKTGEQVPVWATGQEAIRVNLSERRDASWFTVEWEVFAIAPGPEVPPAEPLPLGITEPPPLPTADTRTRAEQAEIDATKRGYQQLQEAGLPLRTVTEEPPPPEDPHADADDLGDA